MGNKPESSVGGPASRTYLPRQFSDDLSLPLPILSEDDQRHGSVNGYTNFRCRCDPCKAAWSTYKRAAYAKSKANAA